MFERMRWALLAGALFVSYCGAQPQVSYVVPMGLNPGKPNDIVLYGTNLAAPTRFWSSFPATSELTPGVANNGQDAAQVSYRLTIPAEAALGLGAIRMATNGGVTAALKPVLLDDLPTVLETADNHTPATAQEITFPTAVEGAAEAESMDYFKFAGVAGQRVTVEVYARRLGTPLDPVVRLIDINGRELAYSDDEGGLGPDARFAYTLPGEGMYFLELRDIRYQGAAHFRYRMRIGNFPLVTSPYPLAGRPGTTSRLTWLGPQTAGSGPFEAALSGVGTQPLAVLLPGGQGSALATIGLSGRSELVEFEPNDDPAQAVPLTLPGAISGRFQAPRDHDYYSFDAKAGQRWLFIGQARSLGSPTDLMLRIHNVEGAVLGEADDAGTEEGVLDFTAPADGTFRLHVHDLHQRGGPEHGYRVAIEPFRAGVSLSVNATGVTVPQGGVLSLDVSCGRRDFAGPVTLALRGAPEGTVLTQNVIPEGADKLTLLATLPVGLVSGSLTNLRVVGTATIAETPFETTATTLSAIRANWEGWPYPPAALDGDVALGVGPVFGDFFKLTVEPAEVAFPQLVGTATFQIKAERMNGFDGEIALAVDGLPAEITGEVKPVAKGAAQAELKLTGPAALAEGSLRFRVIGSASHQSQPKQASVEVPVRVVRPLAVTVEPAGGVTRGAAQKLKVKLTRFGAESNDVAITFRGLPAGVTVPADAKVPAGASEVEIELTASAEAPLGKLEGLVAIAAATIAGRPVQVESPAFGIDVAEKPAP